MVDKISGLGQNPMPQSPQTPVKKANDKPITIMKGMTVADVQKYGSEAQKIAAALFDCDLVKNAKGDWVKDGLFTEGEAEYFNNHDFTLKDNVFTMYNREADQTIEIKYDNIEDLKNMFNYRFCEPTDMAMFDENGKVLVSFGELTNSGKITLDLTNKTVTADGIKGSILGASGEKVTVKNSDLEIIASGATELEIENTRDAKRIRRDKATKVKVLPETCVKVDDASKVDIERE